MTRALSALIALVALAACAPDLDGRAAAIVGGTVDVGDPAVLALTTRARPCGSAPSAVCSGALIAPRAVLTAAHCVVGEPPSALIAVTGPRVDSGERVEVHAADIHPDYDGTAADLAVIELATPLAHPPLVIGPLDAADLGAVVRVVGFGADENAATGSKRQGTSRIAELGETTLVLAPDPALPCHADSGGPVLLDEQLVGVVAHGDPECAASGTVTRVDAHAAFVTAALARIDERTPPQRPSLADACQSCEHDEDCPRGSDCVDGSCAIVGVERTMLGHACTDDSVCGGAPCLAGLDDTACRCLATCEPAGGCGCASGDVPGEMMPCFMVVAILLARRRRRHGRPRRDRARA